MGLRKITFEGGHVTSKIDADLYHFLFSGVVGILEDLKSGCAFSLANNTITFSDGYISIYGRLIYLENQTNIKVSPDANKSGYVVLAVDTSDGGVSLYLKESTSGYPSLTQTNLSETDGLFEMAMCAYQKTTTSVTLTDFNRLTIPRQNNIISNLDRELKSRYLIKRKSLTFIKPGSYKVVDTSSLELSDSILYVTINNSTVITFPGQAMFLFVGSNTALSYRYGSGDYSLSVVYENQELHLTCGSAIHKITSIFFKK